MELCNDDGSTAVKVTVTSKSKDAVNISWEPKPPYSNEVTQAIMSHIDPWLKTHLKHI